MRALTEQDLHRLLDPVAVVEVIEQAFRRDYRSTAVLPARTHMPIPGGILLMMPCYDSALPALGVKLVTVTRTGIQAHYSLLDPATGTLLAAMEANWLTDLRTAATSAVATRHLMRSGASTLGIFGTGRQAWAHLLVFQKLWSFRRVLVCGSTPVATLDFCRRVAGELGLHAEPADHAACAAHADVICCCTTATEPLFDGSGLRPGTHLNLVGAFRPDTREVDDLTIQRARVVVDTCEGALAEAGDLLIPLAGGAISRSHFLADLHELISGKTRVRTADDDITLFKSVGCALEDLVVAQLAFQEGC
ncbi:MAG TPA: ornithine cyclodeaminase family protein [Terriglobales bacterium]|nr:ornithine cyclodeaminase family protein [Terriglobales bacterium]